MNDAPEFDVTVREFIDFVNLQVGVYMDSVSGFQGHRARIERQIQRTSRVRKITTNEAGMKTMVWASYEDPSKPDVIHNRIVRASEYLELNSEAGTNFQQQSYSVIIFLFTFWEDEIRPRLASAAGVEANQVKSDIMGDLRILRHAILHARAIIRPDKHRSLKVLGEMFPSDGKIQVLYEDMHRIFVLIKQDLARMLLDWVGEKTPPVNIEDIKDIGIAKT